MGNPERFLGVNGEQIENGKLENYSLVVGEGLGDMTNSLVGQVLPNNNPENPISQTLPQADMETILNLVKLVYQYASENGGKSSELKKLVDSLEQIVEE